MKTTRRGKERIQKGRKSEEINGKVRKAGRGKE